MRILITGGAGYIGSVLVEKLFNSIYNYNNFLYNNYNTYGNDENNKEKYYNKYCHILSANKVIVYDNLMYKQDSLTEHCFRNNFEYVNGDVRDKELFKKYLKDADVIIPLAAIVGFPACEKNKELATQINYEQIKFILENTSNEQMIISPCTNSGYGVGEQDNYCTEESSLSPISHYGKTKVDAEKLILDSGRGISLRLATVFGISRRMRTDLLVNYMVWKAVEDAYILLFEANFKRNYISISDVALTFIFMINEYEKYKGQAFNVGLSSANLTKLELANTIKKYLPNFIIKTDEYFKDPDQRDYIVSNKKLEETGWHPYYSLDDGIQELIKAYNILLQSNRKFTNL